MNSKKVKLSDDKFIYSSKHRIAEATAPVQKPIVDGDDLSAIRGAGDARYREIFAMFPDAKGQHEPVSFLHPEHGRRIYGWLIAKDADGNARVEIGDGEFAIVPPAEIRRIGEKDNLITVRENLTNAMAHLKLQAGHRRDLMESEAPIHLGDDNYVTTLRYTASFGLPTEDELEAFVEYHYPQTSITHVDCLMPERIAVGLKLAEIAAEAEFDEAVGGEVIETLDPEDVADDSDAEDDEIKKEAITQETVTNAWNTAKSFFSQGDHLTDEGVKRMVEHLSYDTATAAKFLNVYMKSGGAEAVAKTRTDFNRGTLLAAAIPTVQKKDSFLFNQTVRAMGVAPPGEPGTPAAPGTPKTQGTPTTQGTTVDYAQGLNTSSALPSAGGWQLPMMQNRASKTVKEKNNKVPKMRAANLRKKALILSGDELGKFGVPPSSWDLEYGWKMINYGKKGDYVVATVIFDKEKTAQMTDKQLELAIKSFATGVAQTRYSAFGRVHVVEVRPGEATVSFAVDQAGPDAATFQVDTAKK